MQMGGDSKPTVKQSLSAAFNDENSSDLKILVEGKMIHVHKAVLKIRLLIDFKKKLLLYTVRGLTWLFKVMVQNLI